MIVSKPAMSFGLVSPNYSLLLLSFLWACHSETSDPVLHVTLLGGEWSSSAGGLSTINRELAIHLSNHSALKVSLLVPEGACNTEEIR